MCDFAPGDVVIAVGLPEREYFPGQTQSTCIRKGDVVNVSEARCNVWMGLCGLKISGRETSGGALWDARSFRRVYRPDGSLISKLLEPVDLGTEVRA